MAGSFRSRWVDSEEDAEEAKHKQERKRVKLEKQRKFEEAELQRNGEFTGVRAGNANSTPRSKYNGTGDRPVKRRKISPTREERTHAEQQQSLLRFRVSGWGPCRHVDNFERLNHIEEGSYGWVSRAKETATGEIVALKKLKMDNPNDGFPITALREIKALKDSRHRYIIRLKEVLVGDTMNDVFLVMPFIEHDLKRLQEDMTEPFLPSEIKTLLLQLASAVEYLHDHWIIHRDLKTSNILMNNRGEIKIADFGMARSFSDPPPPNLTQLVVTLWYRAPELLLGTDKYGTAIDIWSLGCIFGELLSKEPLLQGKNEVDELSKIFELCGIPTEETWPGFKRLPSARLLRLPHTARPASSLMRAKFPFLTTTGNSLLSSLLSLNPARRPTAAEVLMHPYFKEDPRPKASAMFPTFPSKAGQEKRTRLPSPSAPKRGEAPSIGMVELDFSNIFANREAEEVGAGFQLKLF